MSGLTCGILLSLSCTLFLPLPLPLSRQPYHVVVEVDTKEDVTEELIETKLQETR